jgi:hypothetical protein
MSIRFPNRLILRQKVSGSEYFFQIKQIIDLFEQIGNDYPDETIFTFDSRLQDYRVQSRTKSHA